MKDVHPTAAATRSFQYSKKKKGEEIHTNVLKDRSLLVEDGMEVPASSEWPDRRFNSVTFTTNDSDLDWAFRAFWICGRNP